MNVKKWIKRALFETRPGGWLLASLERWTGLAVVEAEDLAARRAGLPRSEKASAPE